jgi:UDP-N-acetylmuramoylalanine--D-glutamate ligase
MDLNGKRVLVAGAGKTGIATARFLLEKNAQVTVVDSNVNAVIPEDLKKSTAKIKTGPHENSIFTEQDLIIISPGIPLTIEPIATAKSKGVEIIGEIELAYLFTETPIIAVTGTNGKTTTTTLLQHIFETSGKKVFTGGNIGTPLIEYVSGDQDADYIIAEISSFQLETINKFRPYISILLNITEDHLDRYNSFDDYAAAKKNIFANQQRSDFAIINIEDKLAAKMSEDIKADVLFFSTKNELKNGSYYKDGFHFLKDSKKTRIDEEGVILQGEHNRENILAAVSAAGICNLSYENITKALHTFKGLPHRMEFVDCINGINFFDDSKATNVGACLKSISSIKPPIILIAGGKDKGGSYFPLINEINKNVQEIILIGEAQNRIRKELKATVPMTSAMTLKEAVTEAFSRAKEGCSILLSPACSSFDMFDSYVHRGNIFKTAIKELKIKYI